MTAPVLAFIAALAGAPVAAPEPTAIELRYFQAFDSLCLSTLGAPDAVVAAADAARWRPVPAEVIARAQTPAAPTVRGRLGPSLVASGDPAVLFSATSPEDGPFIATTCVLDVGNLPQMDAAHLEALVDQRLGQTATQSAIGPIWAYSGSEPFTNEIPTMMQGEPVLHAESHKRAIALVQIKTYEGRPFLNLTRMGR